MVLPRGGTALLVFDGSLLACLAVGAVVVRRELTLMRRRVALAGVAVGDALEVGSAVPPAADPTRDRVLLFMYAACEPCYDIARQLDRLADRSRVEVVLRNPEGDDAAERILRASLPDGVRCIGGEPAERLAQALSVRSSPLAVAVRSGLVVAKGYVHTLSDVDFLASQAAA
jgi:hypothetical protein